MKLHNPKHAAGIQIGFKNRVEVFAELHRGKVVNSSPAMRDGSGLDFLGRHGYMRDPSVFDSEHKECMSDHSFIMDSHSNSRNPYINGY